VGKPDHPMVYVGLSSMGWDIPWDIKRKSMVYTSSMVDKWDIPRYHHGFFLLK
jgi:hypothetical protein